MAFLSTLLLFVQSILSAFVSYLLLLTAAAWRAPKRTPLPAGEPETRFLFLVPAHNESKLLPTTLASINAVDYPAALFEVHVVADNCSDDTAQLARAQGAIAHERSHDTQRGKGYALQWLIQRIWDANIVHDAIVILDADTIISPNFLRVMDARVRRGEKVIQAYYAVRDPGRTWNISLRYAALAVLHYLRPQGRMVLGGSAGLKGNGMVFSAEIMHQQTWSASITEDIEFHMSLLLNGQRVTFAPDAVVRAEMPATLADAQTQNERWEQGRIDMIKRYVPALLKKAADKPPKTSARLYYDAVMEHLIPPFSILAAASAACFVAAMAIARLPSAGKKKISRLNVSLGAGILGGQLIYLLSGLRLAKAPVAVYRALLYAPAFIIWKLWLYVRVLLGRDSDGWIRTQRNADK